MLTSAPRIAAIIIAASLALVLGAPASSADEENGDKAGKRFVVKLTGEAEVNEQGVPNQGDLNGIGIARLRISAGQERVCWTIKVRRVAPILAAHIHVAPPNRPGPIVVPLDPYRHGCTHVDRDLARAILRNPGAYYVNVHNEPFPAGALRGQLSHRPSDD